jgi:TRAP-type mannitol/chloroaromatic compound transport system substrate-binding protein
MDRRKFVGAAGLAGAAGLLSACGKQAGPQMECEGQAATQTFEWKMVTSWPRDFPGLGTGANRLAESINELSNGRLKIKVYGGNELVPPFEVFDAVQQRTAEMGHSATYYWKGKAPAAQFFAGIPFGMTAQELHGWIYYGGGLERIPGLGGEILRQAGGTPTNIPGAELFTALQTGTIDATEWVGPYNDLAFGLFRAAKYYYYPGWHETGTGLECMINQDAWNSLPVDLQAIVRVACQAAVTDTLSDFTYNNGIALKKLLDEHGVELRRFPDEVLSHLGAIRDDVMREMAAKTELMDRIYASFQAYQEIVNPWTAISDRALLNLRPDP